VAQNVPSSDPRLAAFDPHAVAIAKRQYFQPGDGDLAGMFRRVAAWVASSETRDREQWESAFYELMVDKRFCPGGRVLAGAATNHGNVLNCFVQDGSPAEEGSNAWVLSLATKLALVTKVGGGNGLNLDPLRPKRSFDGPRGTLWLTIDADHPDHAKVRDGTFLDLVHGSYVTKGYRTSRFAANSELPDGVERLVVGDSVEGIWRAAGEAAMKLLDGHDLLLDLSELRAEGTPVDGSGGTSSGPSSFAVEVFDNFATWAHLGGAQHAGPVATLRYVFAPTLRVIRQGGTRRGAGMATLSITHPDVRDFVTAKDLEREQAEGDISTFNISVLVSDAFMNGARKHERGRLQGIAEHAWATGEPGLIFIDRINAHNPMRAAYGDIKSTNPCFTADTRIATDRGLVTLGELYRTQEAPLVLTDRRAYGAEAGTLPRPAAPVFLSDPAAKVYRLVTEHGHELRATADHKFLTPDGWRELSSLVPGDTLLLQASEGLWSDAYELPAELGEAPLEPVVTGVDGRRAVASRMTTTSDPLPAAPAEACWSVQLSRQLAERSIRAAADGEGVPEAIFSAPREAVVGYLQGLFDASGTVELGVRPDTGTVRLSGASRRLLRDVQLLLSNFGIVSWIGARGLDTPPAHTLTIDTACHHDFARVVGFLCQGRPDPRDAAAYQTRVVSVAFDAIEPVYDTTEPVTHSLIAGGIVAHQCGEIPLYPGEPCDLGAMNLAQYVTENGVGMDGFDTNRFREDVATTVRFLDDVLEVNRFALEDNRAMSMKLRRLGLGVMGLADALIKMGYAYDSDEGRAAVHAMISELHDASVAASGRLAEERGAFPGYDASDLQRERRNVAVLTVAPTGTTSMLMGVSSGVEPVFAPFIYRKIGDGYAALIHPLFKELLDQHPPHPDYARMDGGWDWDALVEQVQENHGSVQGLDFVPDEVKAVLICAHDIRPADHVKMQGVVQRAFDAGAKAANSISKTINLPNHANVEDVFDAYVLAFDEGCKGITVYRDGSRQFQVLSTSKTKKGADGATQRSRAEPAPATAPAVPTPVSGPPTVRTVPPPPASDTARAARERRMEQLPSEPLFDRPGRLEGFTDAVKLTLPTGESRGFYVILNKQDGLPSEVFILSGKAGDEANADSEALGRVVSIALQYGVPAEALVKTLRGINGGMYGSYQGRMVASKADLIAVALETAGVDNVLNYDQRCPDCGAPLRFEEGCRKCESCGYSKCG